MSYFTSIFKNIFKETVYFSKAIIKTVDILFCHYSGNSKIFSQSMRRNSI